MALITEVWSVELGVQDGNAITETGPIAMAKKDKYLLDKNGEPYRTAAGNPMLLDQFDGDPSEVTEFTDEEIDADIQMLGLSEFLPDKEIEDDGSIKVEVSRQLEEVLSWRFMAEMWRRFPDKFTLIEAHPGGGQYDSLALMTKDSSPQLAIDVNRGGGSIHVHKAAFGLEDDLMLYSDWMNRMLQPMPEKFLDEIAQEVRLVPPKKLSTSTPATIVYRFIADFLTHCVGRLERWECRNGYKDTSGYGAGERDYLFEKFPSLRKESSLGSVEPFLGEDAYSFWFLQKNEIPIVCLDTNGLVYRNDGSSYDLADLYEAKRRIWPLILEAAGDVLP